MTTPALPANPVERDLREISFIPFGADEQDMIRLNIKLVKEFVAVKTKKGHTCTDEQALKAMMFMKARKLNPYEGDCYLIGYDTEDGPQFSVVNGHQAYLKRAEVHPDYDGMESGVIVRQKDGTIAELQGDFYLTDQVLVGGWAKVWYKSKRFPVYKKLNLSVFNKGFSQWKTNPGGMIVKCAEADALRTAFPSVLGGMYLREEIEANTVTATVLPATQSRLVKANWPQKTLPATPSVTEGSGPAPENSAVARPSESPVTSSAPVEEPRPKRSGRGAQGSPPVAPVQVEPPKTEQPTGELGTDGEGDPFAEGTGVPPEEQPAEEAPTQPLPISDDPATMTTAIRNALRAENLSEAVLVDWCRSKEWMNEKQNWISLMNSAKLRSICERWPDILAELKGEVVP